MRKRFLGQEVVGGGACLGNSREPNRGQVTREALWRLAQRRTARIALVFPGFFWLAPVSHERLSLRGVLTGAQGVRTSGGSIALHTARSRALSWCSSLVSEPLCVLL